MRRTGILSDAGTARHCALGRPVPLGRQDLLVQSSGNNPLYYRPQPKEARQRPRPSRAMYMTEASSALTGENESVKYTERIRKPPPPNPVRYMEDVSPFLPATDMYGRPRPAMSGTGPSWLEIQADPMRYAAHLISPLEGAAADIASSSRGTEGRLGNLDTRIGALQAQLRQQGADLRDALVQIGQPPLADEGEREEAHTIANYLGEAVEQLRDAGGTPNEEDIAQMSRMIERNMPKLKRTAVMKAAVGETMDWMEEFDIMTQYEQAVAEDFAGDMYDKMMGEILEEEAPRAADAAMTASQAPSALDLREVGGSQAGAMRHPDEGRKKAEKIIRKMKANPNYIPNPTEVQILKNAWIQGEKMEQPLQGVPGHIVAIAKQEIEAKRHFEEQEAAKQKGGKKKKKLVVVPSPQELEEEAEFDAGEHIDWEGGSRSQVAPPLAEHAEQHAMALQEGGVFHGGAGYSGEAHEPQFTIE